MGRYYYGDITGKFAFASQSSDAFDEFKEGTEYYSFYHCGCDYNPQSKQKYCRSCFTSYKEFKRANPEPFTKDMKDSQKEAIGLRYSFTIEDLPSINNILEEIENRLGGINRVNQILQQLKYSIEGSDESYAWSIECTNEIYNTQIPQKDIPMWNKYFIGIQLKKCLDETNECNFEANYF